MTTNDNINYQCDEGKVLRRKSDGFIMGDGLSLGESDTIDNYEEVADPNPKPKEESKRRRTKHEI